MPENVVIIGAGCAGLTAAIYCARALLKPVVFTGNFEEKGGLLTKTSVVENYPGFPEGIDGFDLVNNMEMQAVKYGATIINNDIVEVDFDKKPYTLVDSEGASYSATAVIICTGSKPIKLGLENENKFWGKGISSCAVCDGALYRNKNIMVVGGGDSAMEEALFLTRFSDVTLVHRRKEFRASKIMLNRVKSNPKIKIIVDTVIDKLYGDDLLKSVDFRNVVTGEITNMPVDGLFYGLGLKPNTDIFKKYISLDADGYIIKNTSPENLFESMTNLDGIFVAGDCHDKKYKQAITAAAEGCRAALDVEKYLEHIK